jgi:hypothetical protein
MPATAPARLARRQKMPITKAGKNAAAASENAADTNCRMSVSRSAAIKAASKATTITSILEAITRDTAWAGRKQAEVDVVRQRIGNRQQQPVGRGQAAARPPAATRQLTQ